MYNPEDLRPGDIILCEGEVDVRDPLGLLMVWASDNRCQHAVLVGDGELIEAIDGVGVVPLDTYAPVGWRFTVAGATEDQMRRAVDAARRRVGEPYGYRSVRRTPASGSPWHGAWTRTTRSPRPWSAGRTSRPASA